MLLYLELTLLSHVQRLQPILILLVMMRSRQSHSLYKVLSLVRTGIHVMELSIFLVFQVSRSQLHKSLVRLGSLDGDLVQ